MAPCRKGGVLTITRGMLKKDMELTPELRRKLLLHQKNEITEHHIYAKLAESVREPENSRILESISQDELRHYHVWRNHTSEDAEPDQWRIWKYYWISRIFGFTFGIKLMERGEEDAQDSYDELQGVVAEAGTVIFEENQHEAALKSDLPHRQAKNPARTAPADPG